MEQLWNDLNNNNKWSKERENCVRERKDCQKVIEVSRKVQLLLSGGHRESVSAVWKSSVIQVFSLLSEYIYIWANPSLERWILIIQVWPFHHIFGYSEIVRESKFLWWDVGQSSPKEAIFNLNSWKCLGLWHMILTMATSDTQQMASTNWICQKWNWTS